MNRKIAKSLSALLLITAVAVTQVPVSDVEAVATASDFEMDGNKLLRYSGTEEFVSVPDGIKVIGEEAFAGNDSLVKVEIGNQVKSIGYRAFAECDSLRTISVGDGVEEIDTAAFSNDKELVNVSLGAGVKRLGSGVFAGSNHLERVSVSDDNSHFHYSNGILYDADETKVYALMPAFEKTAYTLPSTVKEIMGYAFWGNPYLERVSLGSGLTQVPAYAFSNCMNLKEVEIPMAVRGIGAKAFEDCVNLASVSLPETLTQIHDTAFDGCPNVEFSAAPGTYGAEYAAARKTSEVEEVEYEDVQDAQVIDADVISEEAGEEIPSTSPDGNQNAGNGQPVEATPSPAGEDTESAPDAEQEGSDESETPSAVPEVKSETEVINNKTLLGESSIVSGRALVFIDNRQSRVISGDAGASSGKVDLSGMENAVNQVGAALANTTQETLGNLVADNARKGKDFPKYTIVGDNRIASQAFYQDKGLTSYEIGEGITQIGEFSFARSGLTQITIPDGVTRIGYGAFYHCDSLMEVSIPDSVTEIAPYAFDKTPWFSELAKETFGVVGDGILISYSGSESVVNIPTGVKQIGPGVFKEHMGITAVNLPDTVEVIGEEAFMNCRNLKTVNGGEHLVKVKDRAFMNCPLSRVTIPETMEEVGLGAYALSGGTDTVVFMGSTLPTLTMEDTTGRLANEEYRTYAFSGIKNAIIMESAGDLNGTVLETGTYGFNGIISTETGSRSIDNQSGADLTQESGVTLHLNSDVIEEGVNTSATIPGNEDAFVLEITDSEDAAERISASYGELYGGRTPTDLMAFDITLYDASGSIPIKKLGRQYINVQMKLPGGTPTENLHVVTLDQDGQLEAVEHRILEMEDGNYIQFTTSHFSPYGIYQYTPMNGQAVVADGKAVIAKGSGARDDTPDTGDFLHPKWFLALGLLAGAVALFFYKGNKKGSRIA